MSFDEWLEKVNEAIGFLSIYDLPDVPYRDWYDCGYTPEEAAEEALEYAGLEMF